MPKTKAGKWSVGLISPFLLLIATVLLLPAASGQRGPIFFLLTATVIPAVISCVAAFFTGLISIIKSKERSVLVFIATAIGLFVLIFVLAELLFPH